MELGDSTLRVSRASIGMKQAAGVEMGVNAMAMMAGTTSTDLAGSRVVQLLNMVTPEELLDTDEYDGQLHLPMCCSPPRLTSVQQKSAKTSVRNVASLESLLT